MKGLFFIVGPTAVGKSEIAADVARNLNAEIVNADAFQVYSGLDLLTAKPEAAILAKATHHLIAAVPVHEEMNAEKFRRIALSAIEEIHSRGKLAIVVGGSGLYIKALTHGFVSLPAVDPRLRAQLNRLSLDRLRQKMVELDPDGARGIDMKNRRRLVRAIEICLLTGRPASAQRTQWSPVEAAVPGGGPRMSKSDSGAAAETAASTAAPSTDGGDRRRVSQRETSTADSASRGENCAAGIFVFRDRDELYARINRRVDAMFERGVIEEVRAARAMSGTASKMIGLREIRELLDGKMSVLQCVAQIQQATRRYAKRQLTWFRGQTNFRPLNLSLLTHNEAVKWISQAARAFGVVQRDD
jgi:tRNA dimethylallyltransferase